MGKIPTFNHDDDHDHDDYAIAIYYSVANVHCHDKLLLSL